jgi:hypothetical protein
MKDQTILIFRRAWLVGGKNLNNKEESCIDWTWSVPVFVLTNSVWGIPTLYTTAARNIIICCRTLERRSIKIGRHKKSTVFLSFFVCHSLSLSLALSLFLSLSVKRMQIFWWEQQAPPWIKPKWLYGGTDWPHQKYCMDMLISISGLP